MNAPTFVLMKRLFPIIITLTVISLVGLILMQIQWISSAIKLKQDQYERSVESALNNVKDSIVLKKENRLNPMSLTSNYQKSFSTPAVLTRYEIKDLIRTELVDKGIKNEFEYVITNDEGAHVMYSVGFRLEYLEDPQIFRVNVSGRSASNTETLQVYILNPQQYFTSRLLFMVLGALLFTAIIITAFLLTIRTMLSQRKLSEIKSDFINNMTHEFKTPIATIQLAGDALKNAKVLQSTESIEYYINIIKEENRRMHKQVERILNAAQLEKDEIKLQLREIDVHKIIESVLENTKLQADEHGAVLKKSLNATHHRIMADEVHFSNIIFNLIDNAIKYAKQNPVVQIQTENFGTSIHIKFIDNGIGMTQETINNIYEKFFRAHTGNKHNVKGFGLGLTYVKKIMDLHQAKIQVESKLNVGSTFTLVFAYIDEQD